MPIRIADDDEDGKELLHEQKRLVFEDMGIRPPTPNTGTFRIALPGEISVAVKVLDGRSMNGHFWVFAGALTDIALNVEIRDVTTGFTRHYRQAEGRPVGRVDTVAFR